MSRRHAGLGSFVLFLRTFGPTRICGWPLRGAALTRPPCAREWGHRRFVNFNLWGGAGTMRV